MSWLVIVPVLFAWLDRLRGTDSKLTIGGYIIGNSVWYSSTVGLVMGLTVGDVNVGLVSALLFEIGERRNWQEVGYFIIDSHDSDVWWELIARSWIWYLPQVIVLWIANWITGNEAIVYGLVSGLIMLTASGIAKLIWQRWKIDGNNQWTIQEYVRGFLWGLLVVVML